MAIILSPRRWQEQPQHARLTADDGISFAVANGEGLINDREEQSDLRGYWDATTRVGGNFAVTPNADAKTIDIGAPYGDIYGAILHFNVSTAAINSAASPYFFVSDSADATTLGSGLALGAITNYLNGETIAFADSSTTGRTGIATPLGLGPHTIVFQWINDRYELWLDGVLPAQMEGTNGRGPSVRKVMKPYLGGRSGSTKPYIEWMAAAFSYDPAIDMRDYIDAPYGFLRPQIQRRYIGAAAPASPLSASVAGAWSAGVTHYSDGAAWSAGTLKRSDGTQWITV